MKRIAVLVWVVCVLTCVGLLTGFDSSTVQAIDSPGEGAEARAAVFPTSTDFVQISTGERHACGVTPAGTVFCWGENDFGQLGDGTITDRGAPVGVTTLSTGNPGIAKVFAGERHTCALTQTGEVQCWGDNSNGQFGMNSPNASLTPMHVTGLAGPVTQMDGGAYHTCVIIGGALYCWGGNWYGQVGDGTQEDQKAPTPVSGMGSSVIAVTTGYDHTCALVTGGIPYCWGMNNNGGLGDGTFDIRLVPTLVLGSLVNLKTIDAGERHTCAITQAGGLKCWGENYHGELGNGNTTRQPSPVDVPDLTSGVSQVDLGSDHTCALLDNGILKCWGGNWAGQLGEGTNSNQYAPTDVIGLQAPVSAFSAGNASTCARDGNGLVHCWGRNDDGQLAIGAHSIEPMPINIPGLEGSLKEMSAGGMHTCTRTQFNSLLCWGENYLGQVGDGTFEAKSEPVTVAGLGGLQVSRITSGYNHSCLITGTGAVMCWGANNNGKLGDNTTQHRTQPTYVYNLDDHMVAISAGDQHSCAVDDQGTAFCWGSNSYGQLGNDSNIKSSIPVTVTGLITTAVDITSGSDSTCAITNGGGVKCWGSNASGQLGDNTLENRDTPVDAIGLTSGVIQISGGGQHVCALLNTQQVMCWGGNNSGQLGLGHYGVVKVPTLVPGFTGVIAITAGSQHTCALKSNGSVWCWGWNGSGQLGSGTTTHSTTPIIVTGFEAGAAAVIAGSDHTCALTMTGVMKCWGAATGRQLGNGYQPYVYSPAPIAPYTAELILNFSTGIVGSYITVTGKIFPANTDLTLMINGHELTQTIHSNPTGGFIFFLGTAAALNGQYTISIPEAKASSLLTIEESAALRAQEGGGLVVQILPEVAFWDVYLPLVRK